MKPAIKIAFRKQHCSQSGFSLIEILIIVFILALLAVVAAPQIVSSRRLMRFAGVQRQLVASLRDARQQAMSQRRQITLRYDHAGKRLIIYGGLFGALGAGQNRIEELAGSGLPAGEIVYGRPSGVPTDALPDGANVTPIDNDAVEVVFEADGGVADAAGNPRNHALFFYNSQSPVYTAFGVSVLGAGGRAKVWRYNTSANEYAE